jgi:hypothetical protein
VSFTCACLSNHDSSFALLIAIGFNILENGLEKLKFILIDFTQLNVILERVSTRLLLKGLGVWRKSALVTSRC